MRRTQTKSGIYKIVNTINGKYYVGSSINIDQRWTNHRKLLNKNIHQNSHLQNAWNKYGATAFEFVFVENVSDKNLLLVEQTYLDAAFVSRAQYNILSKATSVLGRKDSIETRMKKSLAKIGKKHSMAMKEKMRVLGEERQYSTETRVKMSVSNRGNKHRIGTIPIVVVRPDGTIDWIFNRAAYCRKNCLNPGHFGLVINGQRNQHKGFFARRLRESEIVEGFYIDSIGNAVRIPEHIE